MLLVSSIEVQLGGGEPAVRHTRIYYVADVADVTDVVTMWWSWNCRQDLSLLLGMWHYTPWVMHRPNR
jgi:glucose dehydrogenase